MAFFIYSLNGLIFKHFSGSIGLFRALYRGKPLGPLPYNHIFTQRFCKSGISFWSGWIHTDKTLIKNLIKEPLME